MWQAIKITLRCGSFSYAEIPRDYLHVMGVTGTFTTLSTAERAVLTTYNINQHTLVPSVYGDHQLKFDAATAKCVGPNWKLPLQYCSCSHVVPTR